MKFKIPDLLTKKKKKKGHVHSSTAEWIQKIENKGKK